MNARLSRHLRPVGTGVILMTMGAGPLVAGAQSPVVAAPIRCDTVLTNEEATAAAGDGYGEAAVDEPRPGFTRCEWQGDDTNFGFTFTSLQALKDDERTPDQEFELEVSKVEDDTHKRELIPGIGVRTALVPLGDGAALLAVQRADGVARMIVYKVDREKTLALARAIATP